MAMQLKVEKVDSITKRVKTVYIPCITVTALTVREGSPAHLDLGEEPGVRLTTSPVYGDVERTVRIPQVWDRAFLLNEDGKTTDAWMWPPRNRAHGPVR